MSAAHEVPAVLAAAVPDDGYLLDVREQDEWQAGHAPRAVHIPLGELHDRLTEVPTDRHVYVVCRSGARSAHAAAYLNMGEWSAFNVDGGMQAWEACGRAMITESGAPPYVA